MEVSLQVLSQTGLSRSVTRGRCDYVVYLVVSVTRDVQRVTRERLTSTNNVDKTGT